MSGGTAATARTKSRRRVSRKATCNRQFSVVWGAFACGSGSLELNPFLPLVAGNLLESIETLANACDILRRHCVEGIEADEERCREHVESSTALATALLPAIGHERAAEVVAEAAATGRSIRRVIVDDGLMSEEEFEQLITPEAVTRLGY